MYRTYAYQNSALLANISTFIKIRFILSVEKYFFICHFHRSGWQTGVTKADAQNLARRLTDTPANLMTPTIFAQVPLKIIDHYTAVEMEN